MLNFKIPTTVAKLKKKRKTSIWDLIIWLPIFATVFGFGIWISSQVLELKKNGIETNATVTAVSVTKDDDGGNQYRPTFEFLDGAQNKHQKTTSYSSSTLYTQGQIIDVIYLAESPLESVRINHWTDLWLLPMVLLLIGLFGELGIIFGFVKTQSQKNSPKTVTQNPQNPTLLLTGAKVSSRYWQTVRENGQKMLEVQYVYENQSYKTRSQPLSEKQLKKLIPGEEITLRVNPRSPDEAIVMI